MLRTAIGLNPTKPHLIFMPKFLHILSLLKGAKSVLGPSLALLAKDSFQKKCMVSERFEPAIPSMAGRAADHWAALSVAGINASLMSKYLLALRTSIQLLKGRFTKVFS